MDTANTYRRALKPSEDKEDRLQRRREREKARRAAETAEERQERLAKQRERETGLGAQPRLTIRGGNERGLNAWQRQMNKSRKDGDYC